jgi:hypothetical protein
LRRGVTRWLTTVEIQFAEPERVPPPIFEAHVDPVTGENVRALEMLGATLGTDEQRAALSISPPRPVSSAPAATPPVPAAQAGSSSIGMGGW